MKNLLSSTSLHHSIRSGLERLNPKRLSRTYREDEDGIAAIVWIAASRTVRMLLGIWQHNSLKYS